MIAKKYCIFLIVIVLIYYSTSYSCYALSSKFNNQSGETSIQRLHKYKQPKYKNESISTVTKAFWPLNEGTNDVVYSKKSSRYCGLLRGGGNGKSPRWISDNKTMVLSFPGGKGGGVVEIYNGGQILFGRRFEIRLELQPEHMHAQGTVVTCKHASSKAGGFQLFYWGAQKKIIFSFADGTQVHKFEALLPEMLSPETWTPVIVKYDSINLFVQTGEHTIMTFYAPGLVLERSLTALLIGGYYNVLSSGFNGKIRNVSLASAKKADDIPVHAHDGAQDKKDVSAIVLSTAKKAYRDLKKNTAERSPKLDTLHETMFIANNLIVPNWFKLSAPGGRTRDLHAVYFLDVPTGVELVGIGTHDKIAGGKNNPSFKYKKIESVTHDGVRYTRFMIDSLKIHKATDVFGPLYLKSSLPDGTELSLYFSSLWDEGKQKNKEVRLLVRSFPTPGSPTKISTCIGSMRAMDGVSWPDFLDTYGKLGFNTVPVHGLYDKHMGKTLKQFAEQVHGKGYYVLYADAPFHSLKKKKETNSIHINSDGRNDVCPSYRGSLYKKELLRVARFSEMIDPDYIIWDIECFSEGAIAGRTGLCERCNEYIRRSDNYPADAMTDLGTEIVRELHTATHIKGKFAPLTGLYHTKPGFVYHDTFNFNKLYRNGADFCMPVYYDSKKRKWMGAQLRNIRSEMNKGNIYPFLHTGTLREYPSAWVYDGVLESFGSGCRGITWYAFRNMEGSDLFYFSKAMESVNPVEDIVYDGEPLAEVASHNQAVTATAIRKGNDYVFLLSNYRSNLFSGSVTVAFRQPVAGQVWDLARKKTGGQVRENTVEFYFKAGASGAHTALYYVGLRSFTGND